MISTHVFLTVAASLPGSGVGHSVGAGSPFTNYTAAVVVAVLIAAVLVVGLLIGAFLVLSLGLLSKRTEDRVGQRTPSDLGILKTGIWPEEPYNPVRLPAEEELSEDENEEQRTGKSA